MFLPRQIAIQKPKITTTTTIKASPKEDNLKTHDKPSSDERPRKRHRTDDSTPSNAEPAPKPKPKQQAAKVSTPGGVDKAYAAEAICCVEMLLSRYSREVVNGKWLDERWRNVDGHDDFIHLVALLEHGIFATLHPEPSQKTLLSALEVAPSPLLELSKDGYHIRRPITSTSTYDESQWDDHTIYIEPNIIGTSSSPGRTARLLKSTTTTIDVEWVTPGTNAWAFVALSRKLSDEDTNDKTIWPEDWIVLTKAEWKKRDTEYQLLRTHRLKQSQAKSNNTHPTLPISTRYPQHPPQPPPLPPPPPHGKPPTTSSPHESPYPKNLIIYLQNIHPQCTKPILSDFLRYTVKKYIRKHRSKHSSTTPTPSEITIDYIDYKPKSGFTTAHLRLKTAQEAELLVEALRKRKRVMKSGEDVKGWSWKNRKGGEEAVGGVGGESGEVGWVKGEVITGERERAYWEGIMAGAKKKRR